MNRAEKRLDLNEQDLFFDDVADAALEAAAYAAPEAAAFTIAMCTGNAECPF